MKIGAQLYTVRANTQTPEDFSETLKKIADIGYKTVQVSGTCAFEAEWLQKRLSENGLECAVTHTPADRILTEPEKVANEHKIFGCRYCGLGWTRFDLSAEDSPERFSEKYLPAAKKLAENGVKFMYHNHDQEFQKIGGKTVLERLSEEFPPELMGFIVDTFWVQAGGADPAAWLRKLAGRAPCIHLKDFAYGRKYAVLGEGNMNFDAVFEAAEESGTEFMLVEQDDCYGEDPFECLRRSYEFLKANGFE